MTKCSCIICHNEYFAKGIFTHVDRALIEQYGWYQPKNRGDNLYGVSRDHMISRRWGFENNIPPEHIAHPANCRLIRQSENASKSTSNSITYEELLERIAAWKE